MKPAEIHVCLASRYYFPYYAGAALRFQKYAPLLRERGIRMSVFTQVVDDERAVRDRGVIEGGRAGNDPRSGLDDGENGGRTEVIDGVRVQRVAVPPGWRGRLAYYRSLFRHCARNAAGIDAVQLLSLDYFAGLYAHRLHRLHIPVVLTQTMVGDMTVPAWRRTLRRLSARLRYTQVDRVVASTTVMRDSLREAGVRADVRVIPNGVDLQRYRPPQSPDSRKELRRKLGFGADWQILLAIGAVSPRKGSDVLIEAFSRLSREHPHARLVLVGPSRELGDEDSAGFGRALRETLQAHGAADRVILTGPVRGVEEHLQAADLLVFPSRQEGMGNVVLEAMATALPVILTPFVGLAAELGTPDEHYALSTWDPRKLAADIGALLGDEDARRRLGRNARARAEAEFDVSLIADRYAALYRELASARA